MKEFIEILMSNPDKAFDYICNNYYNMSKEELKDITKELLYTIYNNVDRTKQNTVFYDVALELVDVYDD